MSIQLGNPLRMVHRYAYGIRNTTTGMMIGNHDSCAKLPLLFLSKCVAKANADVGEEVVRIKITLVMEAA